MTVNVATAWRTNADMIVDVWSILREAGLWCHDEHCGVLDVTYGDGRWWTRYRPENFIGISRRDQPGHDFRHLRIPGSNMPMPTNWVHVVALDPPYSAKGGRETSGVKHMDDAYGLTDIPKHPDDLLAMNVAGLTEACRVATHVVLLKSMDFVTSGELHCHTRHLEAHAESLGWSVYDRLVHLPTGGRPQPQTQPCRRCAATGRRLAWRSLGLVLVAVDAGPCEHCNALGHLARRKRRARQRPSTLTILVPHALRRGAA